MSAPARLDRALRERVHRWVLDDAAPDVSPQGLRRRIVHAVAQVAPHATATERQRIVAACVADVTGLGPLEPFLRDPSVTEIMCCGRGETYVERRGALEPTDLELDSEEILRLAHRAIAPLGLRLDRSSPVVDARLPDGTRIHAVIPPLAVDGPSLTIRRFTERTLTLADFGCDSETAALLEHLVVSGWNLLVAGGTSSGKTSMVNVLSAAIPAVQRIVTIEETAELRLRCPHVVRLEARPANAEGAGAVSVRDLVRTALRMRPDRIIVGEARGAEAFDMVQAGNTGHDGGLATVHANNARAALLRVETLAQLAGTGLSTAALRAQIATAFDAVVMVVRDRDGQRQVREVVELDGQGARMSVRTLVAAHAGTSSVVATPSTRAWRRGS